MTENQFATSSVQTAQLAGRLQIVYLCILMLSLSFATAGAEEVPGFYIKGGIGVSFSEDTAFSDRDCRADSPAPFFGCSPGNDGTNIGARGDFGNSEFYEIGGGYRVNNWLRVEALAAYRPVFSFSGLSNFAQVDQDFLQNVTGDATSFTGTVNTVFDVPALLGADTGDTHLLLLGGAGVARNRISSMRYSFPTTETRTPGGSSTEFTWNVGGGVAYDLSKSMSIELIYRYSDLGHVSTGVDRMAVSRKSDNSIITDSITINETRGDLAAHELLLSIIWYF